MTSLKRAFALGLLCISLGGFVSGCGPEKSSDDLLKDQQDRSDKLSRNELEDLAAARRPQIPFWVGCYKGTYLDRTSVVNLVEHIQLVTPKDQVTPLEIPEIWAFLRAPSDPSGEYGVSFTHFDANETATFISLTQVPASGSVRTPARIELTLSRDKNHQGFFQGNGIVSAAELQLKPMNDDYCRIKSAR